MGVGVLIVRPPAYRRTHFPHCRRETREVTHWCRALVWPTVREIASTAAMAPSTSIHAVGSSAQLRTVLIESERRTIDGLFFERLDRSRSDRDALESASKFAR